MKISLAQIRPFGGDLEKNISLHIDFIEKSVNHDADAVFFPELSLTGYEPLFAGEMAFSKNNPALEVFQNIADKRKTVIGVGFPQKTKDLPRISMLIFRPDTERTVYSKQWLHEDELMFFSAGSGYKSFDIKGFKIMPSICYESLLEEFYHNIPEAEKPDIVISSVAKSKIAIEESYKIYPVLAEKFGLTILMVNSVGFCDNFESAGISWVANRAGKISGFLEQNREGIMIFDTETPKIEKHYF